MYLRGLEKAKRNDGLSEIAREGWTGLPDKELRICEGRQHGVETAHELCGANESDGTHMPGLFCTSRSRFEVTAVS